MTSRRLATLIDREWNRAVLPTLTEYIAIPNKSPQFDPDWEAHGHIERAIELVADFCRTRAIEGLRLEVLRLPGRTPLLMLDVPARGTSAKGTVLLYGHL